MTARLPVVGDLQKVAWGAVPRGELVDPVGQEAGVDAGIAQCAGQLEDGGPHVVAQEFSLHRVHLQEQFADVAALKCVLLRFHDELGEFRE